MYLKAEDKEETSVYPLLAWAYYQGSGTAKNDAEAAKWFRKAGELNDVQSQYMLGYLLEQGKNFSEAAQWYQKAAEQGVTGAQESLGALYFAGQGVQQDYAQAAKWYRQPAENGSTYAQYLLGYIYESGKHGAVADPAQAVKWYRLAAEKGDGRSQLALGYLLSDDKAGQKDLVKAHMWSNLAAAQLSGDERTAAERQREYIASKLSPDQLVKAQQMARDWKPKT
jgi:TPR repeat protein